MSQDGTRKRMEEGRLYFPGDTDILKEQEQYMELLYDYNATRPGEKEKRRARCASCSGASAPACQPSPGAPVSLGLPPLAMMTERHS